MNVVTAPRRQWPGHRRLAVIGAGSLLAVTGCAGADDPSANTLADGTTSTTPTTSDEAAPASDDESLTDALRNGGLVIVFRHAATDRSQPDAEPVDLDDCATQRNLTDDGRADATMIGEAFRAHQIPVGAVWASPYCRAQETAELAFGTAEIVDGLEQLYPARDEQADQRVSDLIRQQAPGEGEPNLVIAGHGAYPSVLAPAVTLEEGEAAVYSLRGGAVTLLGRVLPDEWATLAPVATACDTGPAPDTSGLSATLDEALDSVVSVHVVGDADAGSGFRVALPGFVVTTAAVVADADTVEVTLRDGTRRTARVAGRSPRHDIAVLELDDSGLPPLHSRTGLADARPGDQVVAVGFRRNQTSEPTWSTLVALDVSAQLPDGTRLDVVAFDAAVDHTAAGGPLINTNGDVLGVVTTTATTSDPTAMLGSAIPVDVARSQATTIAQSD